MAVPAGPLVPVIGIQSLRSMFCFLFSADDATDLRSGQTQNKTDEKFSLREKQSKNKNKKRHLPEYILPGPCTFLSSKGDWFLTTITIR